MQGCRTVLAQGLMVLLGLMVLAGCGGGGSDGEEEPSRPAVAIAGVIEIEAGTRVDQDNADALMLSGAVAATEPQSLPPEFVLAGYVSNGSGLYDSGFQYFQDPTDQYLIPSSAGFTFRLQAFGTGLNQTSPVEFLVIDPNDQELIRTTVNPATLSLPDTAEEGVYQVQIRALGSVPMLYVLSAGRTELVGAQSYQWPDPDFVADEAIVRLRPAAGGPRIASAMAAAMTRERELQPGLWQVRRSVAAQRSLSATAARAETLAWIQTLRADPAVEWASPNYRIRAFTTPAGEPIYTDAALGQQWHYSLIQAPVAWQLANGGQGVRVAIFDTGLFRSQSGWHSDLAANVDTLLYDAVDAGLPVDPGSGLGDSVYHGTHVAGTVAGVVNGQGGAGVAYNASLVPVRVLGGDGTGTLSDLIEAMRWVTGADDDVTKAEIVNLSLGGLPCNEPSVAGTLQSLIDLGVSRGMLFVAAAGNAATSAPSCPAALANVLSVSAVDGAGNLASYSNFGPTIDLAAPGGDATRDGDGNGRSDLVSSTSAGVIDGALVEVYRGLQGTSMAAPHVSAVLALMKEVSPALTHAGVLGYLTDGQLTDVSCSADCPRTDTLGYGVLNAAKAVAAAVSGGAPEILSASPSVVNLATEAGGAASANVELAVLGDYGATIESVTASASWFTATVTGTGVSAGSPQTLVIDLQPSELEAGVSVRGELTVTYQTDSRRTLTLPVIGQLISDQQARDAGRHFVLLVKPEPVLNPDSNQLVYEPVAQQAVAADQGRYQFSFSSAQVPPGRYLLVAGSDLDNDGFICHAGEACAEYPVSGLLQEIVVDEQTSLQGLRLTTSYSRPTVSASSPDLLPRPGFAGYPLLPPVGRIDDGIRTRKVR